jgi:hypothetical protein
MVIVQTHVGNKILTQSEEKLHNFFFFFFLKIICKNQYFNNDYVKGKELISGEPFTKKPLLQVFSSLTGM